MPQLKQEIYKEFGRRLREFREMKGMTQKELAEEMNVHWTTISKYELGKRGPALSFVMRLSKKFNIDPNCLIEEDEKEDNND